METIIIAFSMFSALPVPGIEWNEKNMRFMLAAFPLVGAVTGILEALWIFASARLSFPAVLTSAGIVVIPLLVTGGIHMDGYMDVSDALSSYGDEKKRREILADPHIGAFAAIHLAVCLIAGFGFASGLSAARAQVILFGCSFVISRCLSALAVCLFPLSKETGLAHTFQSSADRKKCTAILTAELILTATGMMGAGLLLDGMRGTTAAALMLTCAGGHWLCLKKTAQKKFGGLSGDLNGWFLQKAELWMLGALVLAKILL